MECNLVGACILVDHCYLFAPARLPTDCDYLSLSGRCARAGSAVKLGIEISPWTVFAAAASSNLIDLFVTKDLCLVASP